MVLGLVFLMFAALLTVVHAFSSVNPSYARMKRLVPAVIESEKASAKETRARVAVRQVLNVIDPSFAGAEPLLRSLGVASSNWLMAIQLCRVFGALVLAVLAGQLLGAVIASPWTKFVVPIPVFVGIVLGVNRAIKSACLRRRRQIRRELGLGIEIFCIFLESGQSLDQTFRSFCEICGQALPYLAGIQRSLISDIDNGTSYEKAIERWADNLGIEEGRHLSVLFIDSLVHGSELVPHLRQFSVDLVEQRIANARASIGVKSSQLTVVMVLFFLPAILVFLTAPAFTAVATALVSHG